MIANHLVQIRTASPPERAPYLRSTSLGEGLPAGRKRPRPRQNTPHQNLLGCTTTVLVEVDTKQRFVNDGLRSLEHYTLLPGPTLRPMMAAL